jgi:hypothetical protein
VKFPHRDHTPCILYLYCSKKRHHISHLTVTQCETDGQKTDTRYDHYGTVELKRTPLTRVIPNSVALSSVTSSSIRSERHLADCNRVVFNIHDSNIFDSVVEVQHNAFSVELCALKSSLVEGRTYNSDFYNFSYVLFEVTQ